MAEETKKKDGLERVLTYLPHMSAYQMFLFLFCYYGYMGVATAVAGNIFYQYRTNFTCGEFSEAKSEYAQLLAVQNVTNTRCSYNKPAACAMEDVLNMKGKRKLESCFANATLEQCSVYTYSDGLFNETVVKEYDLVCERESTVVMFILFFNIGLTLGPLVAGKVSETIGRIRAIVIGSALTIIVNLILGLNPFGGPWSYALTRMVAIVCALVLALPAMVYPTEVLTPRYRSICGLLVVSTALGAGVLLVVAIAVFVREWRTLQIILTFVPVPMLAAPWVLPESYRWLYSKGRTSEAENALRLYSKRCGGWVDNEILKEIRDEIESAGQTTTDEAEEASLGKIPLIKRTTLILTFCQFVRGLVQFYLLYAVGSLGGNFWLNNVLNNLVGFPAAAFMTYLMNTEKFGRRGAFAFGLFAIVASSGMRVLSIMIDNTPLAMVSSYLGLFGAMGSLAVGHSFTAEFYPTVVRTKGVAVTLTGAMGGAFLVPVLLQLDIKLGSPIYTAALNGIMMLLAGIASLTLPETLGKPMTETFTDFTNLYTPENSATPEEQKLTDLAELPESDI